MLTLLLLRHAKAEPGSFSLPDIDRSLAPRGRDDAPRMGAWLAAHDLIPDYIVCSPLRRTRETLQLVMPALAREIETVFDPAIYEASMARLLAVLRRTPTRAQRVMFVGHNPGFEDLANDLLGSADATAAERLENKYSTAGLAVLAWPAASGIHQWAKVTARRAHLEAFVAPRYLQ